MSESVRRYLPLLLGLCYLLALLVPYAGQQLHAWSLPEELPEVLRPRISQILVALLLFFAALGADVRRLTEVAGRPGLLLTSLAAVWLVPAAVVLAMWWVLPLIVDIATASKLLLGIALVAAMPVANSSAAWTQQSRGGLPWTLSLVVLSIVACPWMIPLVLRLLGLSFLPDESAELAKLTTSFTGMEFVVWVLLPTAVGMLVRQLVGPTRVAAHRQGVLLWSASALLLLNYVNAAVALPQMRSEFQIEWLAASLLAALAFCFAGLAASRAFGHGFDETRETVTALDYSLTMKNTGLALALASDVLMDRPILLLPVFTVTLVQHLFASWLHRAAVWRTDHAAEEDVTEKSA
ncbi:MAG: bile acid:sodium symporter family protein [Aeoliella sp.]